MAAGWGTALVQHPYPCYAYAWSVDRIFLPPTGVGGEGVAVKMCGSEAGCLASLFSRLMSCLWQESPRDESRYACFETHPPESFQTPEPYRE